MEKRYDEKMSGAESQKLCVIRFLKKARRRLSLVVMVNVMIRALVIGFFVGALMNVAALFVPIYGAFVISWIALLGICIIGLLYAVMHFPDYKKTALEIDKMGLQERLTTFVEMEKMELSPEWQELQTNDTYRVISTFDLKEQVKVNLERKMLCTLAGMMVLFAVAAMLPSPNKELAIIQHKQKEKVEEKIEKVEKAKEQLEELKELEKLTEAELAEIDKLQDSLEKAKEELAKAKTQEELEKALERLETKTLQQLSETKPLQSGNLNKESEFKKKLEEFLDKKENKSKKEFTSEELKDILEAEELENLKQEVMEELAKLREEMLNNLSEEEREELLKKLEELEELAKELEELEASLSEGGMTKEQLQELLDAIEAARQNGSLSEALSGQMAQIMDGTLGISIPYGELATGLSGQLGSQGNLGGSNGTCNNGNGNNGSGTGTGGSGNGTGQGQGSGVGGGKNYGSKEGIEKENNRLENKEQITIPGRGTGSDANLTGQIVEGESYQTVGGEGLTWSGEKVDYNEVVGEYTKEAYSRIENNEVPRGMEEVVKSYFEGINE